LGMQRVGHHEHPLSPSQPAEETAHVFPCVRALGSITICLAGTPRVFARLAIVTASIRLLRTAPPVRSSPRHRC
jgi:hypothetical protein